MNHNGNNGNKGPGITIKSIKYDLSQKPKPPTKEGIRKGKVRRKIEAAHEIIDLGSELAEVWDE